MFLFDSGVPGLYADSWLVNSRLEGSKWEVGRVDRNCLGLDSLKLPDLGVKNGLTVVKPPAVYGGFLVFRAPRLRKSGTVFAVKTRQPLGILDR